MNKPPKYFYDFHSYYDFLAKSNLHPRKTVPFILKITDTVIFNKNKIKYYCHNNVIDEIYINKELSFDEIHREFRKDSMAPYIAIVREYDTNIGMYMSYLLTYKKFLQIKDYYETNGFLDSYFSSQVLFQKYYKPKDNLRYVVVLSMEKNRDEVFNCYSDNFFDFYLTYECRYAAELESCGYEVDTEQYERKKGAVDPQVFNQIKTHTLKFKEWVESNYSLVEGMYLEFIIESHTDQLRLLHIEDVILAGEPVYNIVLKDRFGKLFNEIPEEDLESSNNPSQVYLYTRKDESKQNSRSTITEERSFKPYQDVGFFLVSRLCKTSNIIPYVMDIYGAIDISKYRLFKNSYSNLLNKQNMSMTMYDSKDLKMKYSKPSIRYLTHQKQSSAIKVVDHYSQKQTDWTDTVNQESVSRNLNMLDTVDNFYSYTTTTAVQKTTTYKHKHGHSIKHHTPSSNVNTSTGYFKYEESFQTATHHQTNSKNLDKNESYSKFQKETSVNRFTVDRELDLNMDLRAIDFPQIKDNSRYYTETQQRDFTLLRLSKNCEAVRKVINQNFKYVKEATISIQERDEKLDFLDGNLKELNKYYQNQFRAIEDTWQQHLRHLYKDVREKYDAEFDKLEAENGYLRRQIREITEETRTVRSLIKDVEGEKKKTVESEVQRSMTFKLLQDQVERLKVERGLNRASLTKDAQISKMKSELESLIEKKNDYTQDVQDVQQWARSNTAMLNDEKHFRKKCMAFLANLLEPRTNRVGGGYEVDYMSRDEARTLLNIVQNQLKDRTYNNVDQDLPPALKQCYIEYVKSNAIV